jgi:hypothetical protein
MLLLDTVSLSMLREHKPYEKWNIPNQLLVKLSNGHVYEYSKIEVMFKASKFVLDSPPFRTEPRFQVPITYHSMMFDYFKINVYRFHRRHQRVGYGIVYVRDLPMDHQFKHSVTIKSKCGKEVMHLDFEMECTFPLVDRDSPAVSIRQTSEGSIRMIGKVRSHSLPNLGAAVAVKKNEKDKFLSQLSDLLSVFAKHGFPYSNLDILKGLTLLGSYYQEFRPVRTRNYVHDKSLLLDVHSLFKYCLVCYGTAGLVFFGQASLLNLVQRNKSATISYLNLKKEHLLEWNYVQDWNALYSKKPCFYVVYDESRESIVLTVRGTFSLHDVLTDLSGEYVPFMNGFAHCGFLEAAMWIRDHYSEKLCSWVDLFKAKSIIIVGHSLGAAIGSILLVLFHDSMVAKYGDGFALNAYLYATPPSMSFEVIEPYMPFMYSCINEHDPVPFASYGSFLDFKELLAFGIQQLKSDKSTKERLSCLHEYSMNLKKENKHRRLVVPGQILSMYKVNQQQYMEYCSWQYFDLLHFKMDMALHHLPNLYEKSLRKSMQNAI